jgi:hypothetical protein
MLHTVNAPRTVHSGCIGSIVVYGTSYWHMCPIKASASVSWPTCMSVSISRASATGTSASAVPCTCEAAGAAAGLATTCTDFGNLPLAYLRLAYLRLAYLRLDYLRRAYLLFKLQHGQSPSWCSLPMPDAMPHHHLHTVSSVATVATCAEGPPTPSPSAQQ